MAEIRLLYNIVQRREGTIEIDDLYDARHIASSVSPFFLSECDMPVYCFSYNLTRIGAEWEIK